MASDTDFKEEESKAKRSNSTEGTGRSEPRSDSASKPDQPPTQFSSRMTEALSPTGNMYETLWPIIIEQATDIQRNHCLRNVNTFFEKIVCRIASDAVRDVGGCFVLDVHTLRHTTDVAFTQWYYMMEKDPLYGHKPVHLNASAMQNAEWACWGGKRLEFGTVENFRRFCAIGDVDPEKGASQYDAQAPFYAMFGIKPDPDKVALRRLLNIPELSWIFVSRTEDVIFETSFHNPNEDAYAHLFGITGRADKVKRMYEFFSDSEDTSWDRLEFGDRSFI
ncbi:hypothetical protein A7U60_g6272 [Sanghuangporus baumii]|uniref:Uncharacterized protein n=1 Tax=Sanghuangporus baumii TaxID=108892 RepID=A0A9Q5HVE9_SANBA|nr:hypothetical protein A7U60_g6272 [Sanghuangporus baumii]